MCFLIHCFMESVVLEVKWTRWLYLRIGGHVPEDFVKKMPRPSILWSNPSARMLFSIQPSLWQIWKHRAVSQMVSHMLVTPSTHSFCFAFVAMHVSQVLADVPTDSLGSYNPFFEDAVQNDPAEARSGLVLTLSPKRNQNVLKEWYVGTGINYWY